MKKETLKVKATGTLPLVLHNGRLSDPLDEWVKKMSPLRAKKSKTEADYIELGRLEFLGGLYTKTIDGISRIIIPAGNIMATLYNGAKKTKDGVLFKEGMYVEDDAILRFADELLVPELLWETGRYAWAVMKKQGQVKVRRVRPRFDEWWCEFVVVYYDDILKSKESVKGIITNAGDRIGFCDERPYFGRFKVEFLE